MPEHPYHHGDLKAQLIERGLKLLDAEGYQNFSLRKVAKLCGVSQTAPYRHFKNKDDLIGAITGHALDAFTQSLESAVAQHPDDPMAQLKEMGVAYIRFFAGNPEYLRLLFLTDIRIRMRFFGDERVKKHSNSAGILYAVTASYIQAHPEEHYTQDEMALASWGLVHGIATLIAAGELPNDEPTLALAEKVVRGLL